MGELKAGDSVTVRQWADMEKQWGVDEEGDIRGDRTPEESQWSRPCFSSDMKCHCGETYCVTKIYTTPDLEPCVDLEGIGFNWHQDFFKPNQQGGTK